MPFDSLTAVYPRQGIATLTITTLAQGYPALK